MTLTCGHTQRNPFPGPHEMTFMCSIYRVKGEPKGGVAAFCDVFGATEDECRENVAAILTAVTQN